MDLSHPSVLSFILFCFALFHAILLALFTQANRLPHKSSSEIFYRGAEKTEREMQKSNARKLVDKVKRSYLRKSNKQTKAACNNHYSSMGPPKPRQEQPIH